MDLLSELPTEVFYEILKYLSAEDLARCCLVNKRWMNHAKSNHLWKRHCIQHEYSMNSLQETQLGWYQRFLEGKRLTLNWKRGRFRARTINDQFTDFIFMDGGRVLVTVTPKKLKMYADKSGVETIAVSNTSLAGHNQSVILLKESDSVYNSYTMSGGFRFPRYSARIVVETDPTPKCVGVLESTVCFAAGSRLRFYSAVTGKETAAEDLDLSEPEFAGLELGLYAYDKRRILEYNSLGQRTNTFECEGDIIPRVELLSNESIIVADSFSPEEEIWLSTKVLVAWDRRSGKRACRLSEKVKALTLHPYLPVFYFVPKIFLSSFTVVCYDASVKCFLWEIKPRLLLTSKVTSQLRFVGENILYCVLNKFQSRSLAPYDSEHFLVDTLTGEETDCKKRAEGYYNLVWSNRERVAFFSNKFNHRKLKSIKIISYESE